MYRLLIRTKPVSNVFTALFVKGKNSPIIRLYLWYGAICSISKKVPSQSSKPWWVSHTLLIRCSKAWRTIT